MNHSTLSAIKQLNCSNKFVGGLVAAVSVLLISNVAHSQPVLGEGVGTRTVVPMITSNAIVNALGFVPASSSSGGSGIPTLNGSGTNTTFRDSLIPSSSIVFTNGSAFYGAGDANSSNLWEFITLPNTNDWNLFIRGGAANADNSVKNTKIARLYYQAQHGNVNGTTPEFSITMNGTMALGWNQDSTAGAGFASQRGLQLGVGGNHREYAYMQGESLLYDAVNGHFGSAPILFKSFYTNGDGQAYSLGQTGNNVNNGDVYPAMIAHSTDLIGNGYISVYDYFDVTAPTATTWNNTASSRERFRFRVGPTSPGATLFGSLDVTNITDITGTNLWKYTPATSYQDFRKNMHWYDRQDRSVMNINADAAAVYLFDGSGVFGNFSIYDGSGNSMVLFGQNGFWANPLLVGGIPGVSIGKSQNATNRMLEVNGEIEGTILNAKNGLIIRSNAFPITANFGNHAKSYSTFWQSNDILYVISTNSLAGTATTNRVNGATAPSLPGGNMLLNAITDKFTYTNTTGGDLELNGSAGFNFAQNSSTIMTIGGSAGPTAGVQINSRIDIQNGNNLGVAGLLSSSNGVSSVNASSPSGTVQATGYTNGNTYNVTVYLTATAVAFNIKNVRGVLNTTLYTSPTLTTTMPVNLQPGWAISAASGLAGTVLPW